jgi:predicted RNase H-like nuclease
MILTLAAKINTTDPYFTHRIYVGADACKDGWIAVTYSKVKYEGTSFYNFIENLWTDNSNAERILLDVPIGLRQESGDPRPCDVKARDFLKPDRYRSVFTPPIRQSTKENSYEEAKDTQESNTDRSLSRQSWGISDKITAVDELLQKDTDAKDCIRESHPEVCFAAFADDPMPDSKTRGGARAFWSRIDILSNIDPEITAHVQRAGKGADAYRFDNDDLLMRSP